MTGQPSAPVFPKKLLLATDLTPACDRAFDRAIELARLWRAHLVVLHVVEHAVATKSPQRKAARLLLERLVKHHRDDPLPEISHHLASGPVAQTLLAFAQKLRCDILVTGLPRVPSIRERLIGSTVKHLIREPTVSVLCVRNRVSAPYRSIAIAVDASEPARHALERAVALFPGCSFTAVHAYNIGFVGTANPGSAIAAYEASRQSAIHALLECAMDASGGGGDRPRGATIQTYFRHGDPDTVMSTFVQQQPTDLVVLGTHGRRGVQRALLGSVAERVFQAVPCDILTIHCHA